ncbi:MAG TPA: efflux RND transporter periplasmic adaptor subunit [Allosphingosinicella sp.]|jgi:membrane fusion protein (multidrug efflux system)
MHNRFSTILAISASALLLAGCSSGQSAGPPPMPPAEVTVLTVAPTSVVNVVELPGRVAPVRTAEVRARVDGIIEQRLYTEGSDVGRGTPLFRIDSRPLRASLDVQTAAVQRAQAEATNAQAEVTRYRPLVAVDAISKQEFDAAQARLAQARAAVGSAQAQVRQAQLTLGYTTVSAPIAGRVGRAEVTEGALASQANGTLLTRIEQLDPIYVNFTQSSEELIALRRQAGGGAPALSRTVTLLLEDGAEYQMTGTLNFLDQSVDPTTGSVSLRATFRNPQRLLLPGQFVRVRIEAGANTNGIAVPQRAVQLTAGGGSVMLLGPGNVAQPRPIKLGRLDGGMWVVTQGLQPGDKVIVDGLQKVQPGAPVKPVPLGAPARAAAPAAGSPANAR